MPLEKFAEYLISLLEEAEEMETCTHAADVNKAGSSDSHVA